MKHMIHRLIRIIITLLIVTFFSFLLLHLAPLDPATMKLTAEGGMIGKEAIEEERILQGLDKPVLLQYGIWLKNLLRGNLGSSYISGESVLSLLGKAAIPTLILSLLALILALVVSLPLGILAARTCDSLFDYMIRTITSIGNSIPGFLLALVFIYFFALKLKWFPVIQIESSRNLTLPVLTLSIPFICQFTRQIRSWVLEELQKDYVIGARSRGIKEQKILLQYILPNIGVMLLTLISLTLGSLLSGTVIIETIFAYPGLGKLVMDAIRTRDYLVIQGFVIWITLFYLFSHFLIDRIYIFFRPQVNFDKK